MEIKYRIKIRDKNYKWCGKFCKVWHLISSISEVEHVGNTNISKPRITFPYFIFSWRDPNSSPLIVWSWCHFDAAAKMMYISSNCLLNILNATLTPFFCYLDNSIWLMLLFTNIYLNWVAFLENITLSLI